MKQVLLTALIALSGAGLASAISIVSPCSVLELPNGGPLTSAPTCSITADAGFYINSVTLTITSDYTGWQSGTPTVTDSFTFVTDSAGFAGMFGAIPDGVVNTNTGVNPPKSVPVVNYNETQNGNFGALVQESFSMTNTVINGVVTGTSGVMTITGTETPIVVGSAPEPATVGLMGVALLGIGLAFRRKKV
ncbi:MAG TPA: PEP-CTERM sorting domain-containing protein [Bryobacteraceae bacterium]|nr:PEP-CTERM sorting domain-containing protein [Bryobacteraceae bacterium]